MCLRNAILVAVFCLLPSCSLVFPKPVTIAIPPSPTLAQCPAKPVVSGVVSADGKSVNLPAESAKALVTWIHDYTVCVEKNAIDQQAYIDKLTNRLKAVGGK